SLSVFVAWSVPVAGPHRERRGRNDAVPDAAVVELQRQPMRGDKCSLAPILSPNMARIVYPGASRDAGLVDHVHVPALLGDERVTRSEAILHATILSIQVRPLRLGRGRCESAQRCGDGNNTDFHLSVSLIRNQPLSGV